MGADSDAGINRTRRSSAQIRGLILSAGREIFSERGYSGTSTRDLAARAGVAEHLIFRNFGSKSRLFEEAVFVPFEQFVDNYARLWSSRDATHFPMEQFALEYITELYDFLDENRKLMMVLLATQAHEAAWEERLQQLFGRLEAMVREGITEQRFPGVDPALTARLTFGLVMSAAVHGDVLFPMGSRPPRAEMLSELTHYMLDGVAHRGQ